MKTKTPRSPKTKGPSSGVAPVQGAQANLTNGLDQIEKDAPRASQSTDAQVRKCPKLKNSLCPLPIKKLKK